MDDKRLDNLSVPITVKLPYIDVRTKVIHNKLFSLILQFMVDM